MHPATTSLIRRSFIILVCIIALCSWNIQAASPADPYADAVDATTSPLVLSPDQAIGAPDGATAIVVGVLGANLVLDMGINEEGTGDLRVHYQGLNVGVATTVDFLNANKQVITTSPLQLLGVGVGNFTATVAYPQGFAPYRYVRFKAILTAYTIDAVQAMPYGTATPTPTANPFPDPFADAVDPTTGSAVFNAINAVGAPNGTVAIVLNLAGQDLVLDMGANEEGTGNLRVYYQGLTAAVVTTVDFLDANKQLIANASLNLTTIGTQISTAIVTYPRSPTPYRYVRLKAGASVYPIDAVEALLPGTIAPTPTGLPVVFPTPTSTPMPGLDPYADAVDPATGQLVLDAARTIGAPDGNAAMILGLVSNDLMLDMGANEEGTGDLRVYYQGLTVSVATTVEFLDANKQLITTGSLSMTTVGSGASSAVVNYQSEPRPYRYVSIESALSAVQIDAVEALPPSVVSPPTPTPTRTPTPSPNDNLRRFIPIISTK